MNRTTKLAIIAAVCSVANQAGAQATRDTARVLSQQGRGVSPPLETRLFTLQYLTPRAAADLVSPFMPAIARAGVYPSGDQVPAITVKSTRESFAQIDSVLRIYDRPPPSVRLKFQLIAAADTGAKDGDIPTDVYTAMGELFRFKGYKLLSEGTAVSGGNTFQLTMSVDDPSKANGPEMFTINGEVVSVSTADTRSVRLRVALEQRTRTYPPGEVRQQTLLQTGLSVPSGQTVVLGSAAGGQVGGRRALILTVRPEIQAPARGR